MAWAMGGKAATPDPNSPTLPIAGGRWLQRVLALDGDAGVLNGNCLGGIAWRVAHTAAHPSVPFRVAQKDAQPR